MSSTKLPQIWECPDGQILTCQFQFSPDYTPILAFVFISAGIFMVPWLLRMVNKLIFEGTKSHSQRSSTSGHHLEDEPKTAHKNEQTESSVCPCRRKHKHGGQDRSVHPTTKTRAVGSAGFQPLSKWNQANLETPHQSLEEEDLEEEKDRDRRDGNRPNRQFVRGLKKKVLS